MSNKYSPYVYDTYGFEEEEKEVKYKTCVRCGKSKRLSEFYYLGMDSEDFFSDVCTACVTVPDSFVYFIQWEEDGPVKIGVATDLDDRLNMLQVACPYKLKVIGFIANADHVLEKQIHKKLKAYHIRGEWFKWCEEIREIIKTQGS